MGWDLEMNLFDFLNFYNCKREHTTTGQIPTYVFGNFNNEKVREGNYYYIKLEKKTI